MNVNAALRRAMAKHVGAEPWQIVDARVEWNPGGMEVDPTYDDAVHVAPTMFVYVRIVGEEYAREVPIEIAFTALLRAMIGVSE